MPMGINTRWCRERQSRKTHRIPCLKFPRSRRNPVPLKRRLPSRYSRALPTQAWHLPIGGEAGFPARAGVPCCPGRSFRVVSLHPVAPVYPLLRQSVQPGRFSRALPTQAWRFLIGGEAGFPAQAGMSSCRLGRPFRVVSLPPVAPVYRLFRQPVQPRRIPEPWKRRLSSRSSRALPIRA